MSGVRVRGQCKAGHITEATAPKGRVTWYGDCSKADCDLKVLARRIPRERQDVAASTTTETDRSGRRSRFTKVSSYDELQPDDGQPSGLVVEPDDGQLDGPAADPEPAELQVPDPIEPVEHVDEQPVVRPDRRRSRRRRGEWSHPLL